MPEWTFPVVFPVTVTRQGRKMSGRLAIDVKDGQPVCWIDDEIQVIVAPGVRDEMVDAYLAAQAEANRQLGHQSFTQSAGDEFE